MSLIHVLLVVLFTVIVSPFQLMQPKRILPASREKLLRGQIAILKVHSLGQQQQADKDALQSISPQDALYFEQQQQQQPSYVPFQNSIVAKRLRGEPIRFGKRSPREPIRFGKRFNPTDYDFQ